MRAVHVDARFGAVTVATDARRGLLRLLRLSVTLGMDGAGRCTVELAAGDAPAIGDAATIALDGGTGRATVFTGRVRDVASAPGRVRITCDDVLGLLARTDVEATYAETSAGDIARDIASRAGAATGDIDAGPTLASFCVHRGPRALAHVERLAALCGADVYSDGDGALCVTAPSAGPATHTYRYAVDVLALEVETATPSYDSVVVIADGAGGDKQHWLRGDTASTTGKAKLDARGEVVRGQAGDRPLRVHAGTSCAGDQAAELAAAKVTWLASRRTRGVARVLGDPTLAPAARVAFDGAPVATSAPLRVRRLRHLVDPTDGFITEMVF